MKITPAILIFWLAVFLAPLGTIITFAPGAECGWFLLVALLAVAGLFIPKTRYRLAAVALLIFALQAAYDGHQRGVRYQEASRKIARIQGASPRRHGAAGGRVEEGLKAGRCS